MTLSQLDHPLLTIRVRGLDEGADHDAITISRHPWPLMIAISFFGLVATNSLI
jgi:hypothetical protein